MVIKKILLMCVGLVFALIVAAAIVPFFIRGDTFREPINKQLQAATGLRIDIKGDVHIRLLPFAKLVIDDVSIATLKQANAAPFLSMKKLDVGVRLLPLMQGNVEIINIGLLKPTFDLVQTERGNNWQPADSPRSVVTAPPPNEKNEREEEGLTPQSVVLKDIQIDDGTIHYQDTRSNIKISITNIDAKGGMSSGNSPIKLAVSSVWNGEPLKLNITVDNANSMMSKRSGKIQLSLKSQPLSAILSGTLDPLAFKGEVELASHALSTLPTWLSGKKNTSSSQIPNKFSFKAHTQCSPAECAFNNSVVTLDEMAFTGDAKIHYVAKPSFQLNLKTKNLDISPYISPNKQANNSTSLLVNSAFAATTPWSSEPIDLSALKNIQGNISLQFESLKAKQLVLGNSVLRAKIDQGKLSASLQDTKLFGGIMGINLSLNSGGVFDMRAYLDNVALEPMLVALNGKSKISGSMDANVAINSQSNNIAGWVSNLNGDGNITVLDGAIKGVDIASMVRNVKSAFTGGDTSKQKTDFAELSGSFDIHNGIIQNDNLSMKAPLFRLNGRGNVNLPAYTLNYRLTPQFVTSLKGQGGLEKEGIAVPILVTGSLDNPSYAPDLAGAIEESLKNPEKLQETIKGVKEQIKDGGAKDAVKDLKGLLKGF